jgi:hypothetical protein
MIYNEVTKLDEFEKKVVDILLYIEKETDILFDRSTLEGIFAWITYNTACLPSREVCMPTEFYWVNSENYFVRFKIRFCVCDGCQQIINIKLKLTNSLYEEDLEDVTTYLEDLFPDISISPFIPNIGYIYYE